MMRFQSVLKVLAVGLAVTGIVVPQSVLAAQGTPPQPRAKSRIAPAVVDVVLTPDGALIGRVVDDRGRPVDGAVVTFLQKNEKVASSVTDKNGMYVIRDMSGGVYRVVSGQGQAVFRCWTDNMAPASAKTEPVLVSSRLVARAQGISGMGGIDTVTLTTIGLSITALTLSAINLNKISNLDDDVNRIPTSP